MLSGLASFSFQKKQKLKGLVAHALSLEGAFAVVDGVQSTTKASPALLTALQYIDNVAKDIRVSMLSVAI